jgi:hypothetical protein
VNEHLLVLLIPVVELLPVQSDVIGDARKGLSGLKNVKRRGKSYFLD